MAAIGRKRARPPSTSPHARAALRDDVLALIRRCRAPAMAQRERLTSGYDAAWSAFCRVARGDADANDDERLRRTMKDLAQEVAAAQGEDEVLLLLLANSVRLATSRREDRQRCLLLLWAWLGHSHGGLWRLEDAMQNLTLDRYHEECVSRWLSVGINSLLDPANPHVGSLVTHFPSAADSIVSIGRSVVEYLVRVAFTSNHSLSEGHATSEATATHDQTSLDVASLAQDALGAACFRVDGSPSLAFKVVSFQLCNAIAHLEHSKEPAISLHLFFRAQVKRALLSTGAIASTIPDDAMTTLTNVLSAFLSCVSALDIVQLFLQVWSELLAASPSIDPMDQLASLVSHCSSQSPSFRSHALASAHDLACNALAAADASLLRQSLKLVAAVDAAADGQQESENSVYGDWFRIHFAAPSDTVHTPSASISIPDKSKLLTLSSPAAPHNPSCLRAPRSAPPSADSASSTAPWSLCALVSSKRHLQFVCAFLLEFDRIDMPNRRAHHVMAHLSAMKTHQAAGGAAVAGLLSDFCSQTRARHSQLAAKEQDEKARERRRLSLGQTASSLGSIENLSSQTVASAPSQHTGGTRGIVEELLELYARDVAALLAQVNQLKMFRPQQWKQHILPCCLDFAYWQAVRQVSVDENEDGHPANDSRTAIELVGFVQLLAKHHAVGTQEYVAFIDRVEKWYLKRQDERFVAADKTRPRRSTPAMDATVASLREAIDSFISIAAPSGSDHLLDSAWTSVANAFVVAFEELVCMRPADQAAHMHSIYHAVCQQIARSAVTGGKALQTEVERHLQLWIALLSSETAGVEATPKERMQVMDAYCKLAIRQFSDLASSEVETQVVEAALTGSLLGLLASLSMCESIALSCTHQVAEYLAEQNEDQNFVVMTRQIKKASAFLGGFLAGFTKNLTHPAPQQLLQSMLPSQMRESLIWAVHHTRAWWAAETVTSLPSREVLVWDFVARSIESIFDDHAWFRLTFSPGVLTSKAQWEAFLGKELIMCCFVGFASQDIMAFVQSQHDQLDSLVFSSLAGQSAGVESTDVCVWIVRTALRLAPTQSPDALVMLLKDITPREGSRVQADYVIRAAMESTISRSKALADSNKALTATIQYGLRCIHAVLPVARPVIEDMPTQVTVAFFDCVAKAMSITSAPSEWISTLWGLVTRHLVCRDPADVPPVVFAHWAFEFPRLGRQIKLKIKSSTALAALVRAVHRCYEFYRTVGARRLAPSTISMASLLGVSASQYVPTSATDDSLLLHVRSLEWLVARNLLVTPHITHNTGGFDPRKDLHTSLAFHSVANRVLLALLEDLSIGRPDEVAVEVVDACQSSWLASVDAAPETGSSFPYQILLVHMITELASRHASVGRFLLRSSSELLEDARRGLLLFLVLMTSGETEQVDTILDHSASLWINTFSEVACSLADVLSCGIKSPSPDILSLLKPQHAFQNRLTHVLQRLLAYAAAKQIDLLDLAVLQRMEKLFPTLRDVLAGVPVLNLASDAYLTGDF